MNEEHTTRRRLKVAGIAAAAVLAVPGGMAVSNAFAADGGDGSPPATSQSVPVQSEEAPAPRERGDGGQDRPGDRGDCPGKDGEGQGGSGEPGASGTAYTMQ